MAENESIDGATSALHRRIEELTAKLAEAMRSGEVVAGLLATERAARDRAGVRIEELTAGLERELADHCWEDCGCREAAAKVLATTNAHLERAERERDTALEEKEHYRCESERFSKDLNQVMFDLERNKQLKLEAARDRDTALARVKEAEDANANCLRMTETANASCALWHDRALAAETALTSALARVKELERIIDDYDAMVGDLDPPDVLVHWRADRAARLVAETALASAREHAKHRANLDRKNQELSRENERLVDYAIGCQHERETALERVEELEAQLSKADKTTLEQAVSRLAAESALASARTIAEEPIVFNQRHMERRIKRIREALTSHPAPVAAPVDDFRTMLREMAQSWRDEAFGGQHCSELRSNILEECADELSAALGDAEPITADRRLSGTSEASTSDPVAAPCADDPCHHCGKQLRYSHTVTPQFPGGGMKLESRPVYRCDDGHEFERLEVRK